VNAERANGRAEELFREPYADKEHWGQRSVDLSRLAGEEVRLSLEADSERAGSVALLAAPTLSGEQATDFPNVVFYVIDGAAASQMSVYGYNRRTTPHLERLAAQGAVFELAYSNSSWTRPSTASFMSSLQHSSLGGLKDFGNPPPDEVPTMAEHLHKAGYQTAVLATNPNAGTMSNLDRGVDRLREDFSGSPELSSRELHQQFWRWRASYPGAPYWVHFQTTDVHEYDDGKGVAPFAGLFVSAERRNAYLDSRGRLSEGGGTGPHSPAFARTGIDRRAFFEVQRDLYDEAMAHQDAEIGRLVERLQAAGEWENTLFIIAADHSFLAAGDEDFSLGMLDILPPQWGPMFRPSVTRIPLIFVWPGHIPAGQRLREPVSMIDMLPTILDLVGLPQPEVLQGRSLAPLMLGRGSWEPRPVMLDEFQWDGETGELRGVIEMVDGQWGASLEINPAENTPAEQRRPSRLLLCRSVTSDARSVTHPARTRLHSVGVRELRAHPRSESTHQSGWASNLSFSVKRLTFRVSKSSR
jgi:arylsulfatase A-like enzyme